MKLKAKKILITGTSSGIGRALTKNLIHNGNKVWGIARRKYLLDELKNELIFPEKFSYTAVDICGKDAWKKIVKSLRTKRFYLDIVIFNAAVSKNEFINNSIDVGITREIVETNFLSVMEGVKQLLPLLKKGSQVIAISSSSAFKGSEEEGIGYAASKAALSVAFESLYLKYRDKIHFKTVFFGPVKSGMNPFSRYIFLTLSERKAVNAILTAIDGSKAQYFYPWTIFLAIKFAKILPSQIYFRILEFIDLKIHRKFTKNDI